MDDRQYWATKQGAELVAELEHKTEVYHNDLVATGLWYVWERSYRAYYGADIIGQRSSVNGLFGGHRIQTREGAIKRAKANHYRNLVLHGLQLTTAQKEAFKPVASNTDAESEAQTILAEGALDYYFRTKKLDRMSHSVAEWFYLTGEGIHHMPWNSAIGQTTQNGRAGDFEPEVVNPVNCVRNPFQEQQDWYILRTKANKWDLIARFGPKEGMDEEETEQSLKVVEAIHNASGERDGLRDEVDFDRNVRHGTEDGSQDDMVWTYVLYHDKTEAVPDGRYVWAITGAILDDTPLPYKHLTDVIQRMVPQPIRGTGYGYSPAWDVLALQEGVDIMLSTLLSNNMAYGTQSVWSREGDNVSVEQLENGMKLVQSEEMPKPLQLTASAPEAYSLLDKMVAWQETIFGISSTVRGQPEANLKSGAALAMVVSQSLQFQDLIEASFNDLLEDMATGIVHGLQSFAQEPVMITLVGNANRPYLKEFLGKDIGTVDRVTVERTNPVMKTTSGKMEVGQMLLEMGKISPDEFIQGLSTGNFEGAKQPVQAKELLLKSENEALRNGTMPRALVTDHHQSHIEEHLALLNSPEARREGSDLADRVLAHVTEHMEQWRQLSQANPELLFATGQEPLGAGGPPAPGPAPESVPPQAPPPPPGAGVAPASMPNMPQGAPEEAQAAYDQVKPELDEDLPQ